jgi:hypothetical protein
MYTVKHFFLDLQDNGYPYNPGDDYPREGLEPSPERIKELSSDKNLRETALIEKKTAPKKRNAGSKSKAKEEKEAADNV